MLSLLVDVTKCTGCEQCVGACIEKQTDGVSKEKIADRGLSDNRLMAITPLDDGRFARTACMHCLEPSCVSACLVGGLTKRPDGPVVYDASKCIGCRYCMLACPFHVPRYEWESTHPLVSKCDMCVDRLSQGQQPACVEACPNGALLFGDRDRLLTEARSRISSNPGGYINHVWGEHEFGGTGVLYVSDVDLSELGWTETVNAGIPSLTNPLIEKTPIIGGSVAVGLLAVNWIIRRRMRLQAEQDDNPQHNNPTQSGDET